MEDLKRGILNNVDTSNLIDDTFYFNFREGARIDIVGKSEKTYDIKFINRDTNETIEDFKDVPVNSFVKSLKEYFIPWVISVESNDKTLLQNFTIDLKGKTVFITFESSALGDTIAWMPVVDKFRELNECNVIVSSFHNYLFKDVYKNLTFVEKGMPIKHSDVHFSYRLGWFGDGLASNNNPVDCHFRNLQQLAMDILGLDYEKIGELRPILTVNKKTRRTKEKYVCITTCSTAQFKYWNLPNGWQQLVDWLNKKGYKVVNVGKQPNTLNNVINATGKLEMDDLINLLYYSEFFIGLPSGLTWLNWALNKKSIMITGISEHFCEFKNDMYRVENVGEENGACVKCFNKNKFPNSEEPMLFDRNKWLHCPINYGTPKHFECTKSISVDKVKNVVNLVENHVKNKISTTLDSDGNLISVKSNQIIKNVGY